MKTSASFSPPALSVALAAGALLISLAPALHAQPRTATDRLYTDAQAARGRTLYQQKCAECHGAMLEGRNAPPLTGAAFLGVWGSQPLSDLATKIRSTMPADAPGKLQPSETADLVAYILQTGKFSSGPNELRADDAALKSIVIASAKPQAAPLGNLNQVMRGILFPSSNIIFNVQTNDPGAPAKPPSAEAGRNAAFNWTTWGAGIYSPWQVVD